MGNRDLAAAWAYHDATKHSLASLRANRHVLDWENQPLPFKIYPQLAALPLPRDWPAGDMPALDAISSPGTEAGARSDLTAIARLLRLSAGVTRKVVYADGRETYFRAAACTGALYHVDLYLVSGALAGLEPGIYHFGPHDFALRQLRAGDHRETLVAATADAPGLATAPAVLVVTSTFWRNAWKYQARTYRHCFWDSGTMLANLLAAAAAARLPVRIVLGFVDQTVNHLIGADGEHEVALALVAVGHDPAARPAPAPPAPALALATVPLSRHAVDYPAIRAVHAASTLATTAEVAAWRTAATGGHDASQRGTAGTAGGAAAGVALCPLAEAPAAAIDTVIYRRGSTREFAATAIGLAELSTLLARATGAIPADFLPPTTGFLTSVYLIVNAVDGLAPGTYAYTRATRTLEPLRTGNVRREAGFLDLGQPLAADASVNVYLLADLGAALARLGNRGYRAAQLEAAIVGGKVYLAAYALGLGATGLTFFDDAVTDFLSPHAAGKSVMFLAAVGRPSRGRAAQPRRESEP